MLHILKKSFLGLALLVFTAPAIAASPTIGQPAPNFTATDSNGVQHQLSDFKGKNVVLEWTNHQCPFVMKHYDSNNMQGLQKKWTAEDVIWLSIISSAPGKQGHVNGVEANAQTEKRGAAPTAVILDETGEIGKLYGAKTTPHMFIIDTNGTLAYAGAIDSKSSPRATDIEGATNYIDVALTALKNGGTIDVTSTKPYGCGVKYK